MNAIVGFVYMEPETQADGKRPASSVDDAGMATDTADHYNDISALEESIDTEEWKKQIGHPRRVRESLHEE